MKSNRKTILSALVIAVMLLNTACKKNNTGGDAIIHAIVTHGSTPIMEPTAYVKFNAKSAPANPTTTYDLKVAGEAGENHVHIEGLRMGDYYVYVVGRDSVAHSNVSGGAAVSIKFNERKKEKEVEIELGH